MNALTIAVASVNANTTHYLEILADEYLASVDAGTPLVLIPAAKATSKKAAKAKKAPRAKTPYPFQSKAQIIAQIDQDDDFALRCLQVMDGRQTEDEQNAKITKYKNRCGWMSSHAVNGTTLAQKARLVGLDEAELEKARGMVRKYGKQLANHMRAVELARNPALAATAALFGL